MISDSALVEQLNYVLDQTNFDFLGERIAGKVRDSYVRGNKRILITTDRISCFDVVLTTVPFKGEVLNRLAEFWFNKTKTIVSNHLISVPHQNAMVVKNCQILPVEVVVRGYMAGSAIRDYEAGRLISGVKLPSGLKPFCRFREPIITPSTKAEIGKHDEPISESDLVSKGIVPSDIWDEVREKALSLFNFASSDVASRGLILVDTKYEFGMLDGKVTLADEIHTLDSSRFWIADSYERKVSKGESPQMLDKEPTRQWLLNRGFSGSGAVPEFTDQHRIELARHYIDSFEKITGSEFLGTSGPVQESLATNLAKVFSDA